MNTYQSSSVSAAVRPPKRISEHMYEHVYEQRSAQMASKRTSVPWYRWLNSEYVIRLLETVQDFIVICLCIGLFSFMILELREMVLSLLPPLELKPITSDILSLLILVELFRLLIIYLQEHRVSIGVAVEVSIVSVLREVIVHGVLEIQWTQVLVACVFLLVLGALLIVRVWIPPTFDGIDPEQIVSERYRARAEDAEKLECSTTLLPK